MYHDLAADDDELHVWQSVRVSAFERQLAYIREHYDLIDLDQLAECSRARTAAIGDRPRAVITFDDGLRGNAEHLLPIVERERVPVTVYVATRHVETGEPNWCDRLVNVLHDRQRVVVDLAEFGFGRFPIDQKAGAARWAQIQALLDAVKRHPAGQRDVLELVERQIGSPSGRLALAPMTIEQVQALARSPYITIGSHTHGHELLTLLDEPRARATITDSVERLEHWTGAPVRHFCYPNGSYNSDLARLVAELGFVTATTVAKGVWRPGDSLFEIPRIPVSRFDSMDRFVTESMLGIGNVARLVAANVRSPRRSQPAPVTSSP